MSFVVEPSLWHIFAMGNPLDMLNIEDIISTRDLEGLFRNIMSGERALYSSRHIVVRRIRAFAPLSIGDLKGYEDEEILDELQRYERWSVLRDIEKNKGPR